MKEIKLKLFVVTLISVFGIGSIIYTFNRNRSYVDSLTLEQISSVREKLNIKLSNGCQEILKTFRFNENKNFLRVKFNNIDLKGSVYQFKSLGMLMLYEFNLESQSSGIHLRGYLFENSERKSCYGMVL